MKVNHLKLAKSLINTSLNKTKSFNRYEEFSKFVKGLSPEDVKIIKGHIKEIVITIKEQMEV